VFEKIEPVHDLSPKIRVSLMKFQRNRDRRTVDVGKWRHMTRFR
jgi:hypothetical protein